ncbi:MAG TPA: type II CAAX endopeptidase family protein [Rhodanobacteraceae bacterium]|nr:type II CAAX endopeptidase family protein [Rhodanobacteraceae bacterium]
MPNSPANDIATTSPPGHPGIWGGLGTVALYFILQLGLGSLFAVAIGFWLASNTGLEAGLPDIRAITHTALANPDTRVIVAVVTIAAAAAVMLAFVRHTWPMQWSRADLPGFGFGRPREGGDYVAAVALGIGMVFLGGVMTQLLAHGNPVQQDVSVMAGKVSPGMRLLLAVIVVCVAPVVEEVVFRGVLLSGLASRMRVGWAIVVSAVIFGCVHLPDFKFAWYPVPALILLGLLLAWLRVRTHSLWPSITLHATNNFVAAIMWLLVAPH